MTIARTCLSSLALVALTLSSVGCGPFARQAEGLNAKRLPKSVLAVPRANRQPINYLLLRQDPPEEYVLDAEDTLGIYVESVLGENAAQIPFQENPIGNTPPATGYPVVVQDDGTIQLPILQKQVNVKGLTVPKARDAIYKAYVDGEYLTEPSMLVSLYRPRTYQVLVIREDGGGRLGEGGVGSTRTQVRDQTFSIERGTGFILDMPAYENDVLRALMETGGLPGLDAKTEVKIIRGKFADAAKTAREKAEINKNIQPCQLPPTDPADPNVTVIPIRMNPDEFPEFTQDDIKLNDGDVLVVETRERDVFYTGGLLGGGEVPLPRDYDLDVMSAIAVSGGPIGAGFQFGFNGNFSAVGGGASLRGSTVAASEVTIIREAPFGKQFAIKINLREALIDPSQRVLIKPGDVIILDYTPLELWTNFVLNIFPFNTLFDQLIFNRN